MWKECERLNKKGERQRKGMGRRALGELLEVIESDSQCFTSFEIVEEGVVSLSSFSRVFLSKVHKVGAVWKDMATFWRSGSKYIRNREHGGEE